MKNFRNFIAVIATINVLGAIACLIIMFISMNSGDAFWPTYIPISVSLFVNAIVFAFIDDLGGRVDKLEDTLKRNNIFLENPKKEVVETKEPQTVFRAGEPIKLKNKININGKEFGIDSSGMVVNKKENNVYVVEFDNDRGNNYDVSGTDLKSFFDK